MYLYKHQSNPINKHMCIELIAKNCLLMINGIVCNNFANERYVL